MLFRLKLVSRCPTVFITRLISDAPLTVRGSNEPLKKIYKDANLQKEFEKYEMMDPVDINELSRVHQGIARQLDKVNEVRVKEMFIRIYRGMKVCTFWVLVVFAIYFYGCYALGQETFLEEIDEEIAIERGELMVDDSGKTIPTN
uniref:Cytochrome c oxidase assembly factor 3 mitochondrial coiled-coil domain-containing protein n=1 Tax=Meloidogyne incognita TaxID=6306 RepID=A0A914KPB5_MELIC